jgi:hypothetical protein
MVALYIYTEGLIDDTLYKINSFEKRVIDNSGTFEAKQCLIDSLNSLGGSTGVYTTAKRIDLFEDEKISLTSSIQNINDISKVFTDYSQSFTIPANTVNNEIFKHWYENSIEDGFDQRIRYDGYIEIDTQLFRVGKWQIENATIKNNQIENYKITFYGDLKSLMDKFGEDNLKDIETLNDYTISYTGANVQSRLVSLIPEDVMFPLISSDRVWQYGDASSNDISISGGAIDYTELFPAIKIKRIFDAISSKYNLTFNGTFLNNQLFTEAYCWFKNKETFANYSEPEKINFTTTETDNFFSVNSTNDELTAITFFIEPFFVNAYAELQIFFPSTTNYILKIYKNGAEYTSLQGTNTSFNFILDQNIGEGVYEFYLQTSESTTYTYNLYTFYFDTEPGSPNIWQSGLSISGSGSLSSNIDLTALAPEIKVKDFFSGILKMFNLTAFSTNGIDFTLEQLENWYYLGDIKDFTEYTITDNLDFNRIKPYKKIDFNYEKSESILNRFFGDTNLREYGSLSYTFNNDGADYTVKLPFENLLFNKFTGQDLQVAYSLKTDLQKYIPKPVILYFLKYDLASYYFNNGTTTVNLTNVATFGQDNISNGSINSLNWGIENSSYYLTAINNSLFNNYYLDYLSNLYSLKSRMLKLKMHLPYLELLNLKLNDRILIRDKRYIINQYTTDLTTFEIDFELIQDFRPLNYRNSGVKRIDSSENIYDFYTTSKEQLTWTILNDVDGMIDTITNYPDKVNVSVNRNIGASEIIASIISNNNDVIVIEQAI